MSSHCSRTLRPASRWTPHLLSLSPTVLLLALSLSACGSGNKDSAVAPAPVRAVLVAEAQSAASQGPEFIGEVRARQRAELAFAHPGLVRQVMVDVGDAIKRGQLLAVLDLAPSQAQLAATQAEAQRLQTALDEARRKQQRLQLARDRQAASEAEWTAAQAELRMAEAALAAAQAQRDGSAWQHAQAELRAPFDGVVAARQLEQGQAVGSGLPVITVDGAGRELWALLPAGVKTLVAGQRARLRSNSGEVFESRVLRLSARQEAGGARRAVFELPAQAHVGDTWSLRLVGASSAAVWVPLRAVQGPAQNAVAHLLRVRPDGQTLEGVEVRLGEAQGDQVQVLSGLKAGDRVVLAGGHSLTPEVRVKPVSQLR